MAKDANLINEMLDTLENRVLSISNSIIQSNELGIITSNKTKDLLSIISLLICAYNNYRVFNNEQQEKLDILYRKVVTL